MSISSRMGSGMPHRFSAAVDRAIPIPAVHEFATIADGDRRRIAGGRVVELLACGYLPWRCLSSAQNASTLDWSMILVGMMISLLAGMNDLSPSRYLAMSFMPW